MKIWVGRHDFAGQFSLDPKIERSRPLKPIGIQTAQAVAQAMVKADELPNVIFCSPYTRALQTADIYGKTFGIRVTPMDDLSPDRPLADRILELMSNDDVIKRIMLVAHVDNTTPSMNKLGGDVKWDDLCMGEVRRVKIDRKSGKWKIRWGIRPSDLGFPNKN